MEVRVTESSSCCSPATIAQIDWQAPWLQGLRTIADPILQAGDWRAAFNQAVQNGNLLNHRQLPIRFVPQAALPAGTAYETHISMNGQVPTRDNLHDFFNGLIWLAYPQIKRCLNALQAAEIQKSGAVTRGKLRDGATIFDENAALFVTAERELIELLQEHRWHELFIAHRSAFGRTCQVFLFGHALMEKLTAPYKAITAHAWVLQVDASFFNLSEEAQRAWLDQQVSAQLASGLSTANFTPLPVLGIPGWWPAQNDAYYADHTVFRPKRNIRPILETS